MPGLIPFIDELPDLAERLARVRVLYTDLDGTLLGRGACLLADGDGAPSLDAAIAVTELRRAGLTVVMVSGRNARQLTEVSRLLGWRDFIAEMGTLRSYDGGARREYDTGVWVEGMLMSGETPYEAIVRVGAIERLRELFPLRIEYHDPWHLDREVTHILRGNIDVARAQSALDELALPVTIIDNGIIHPIRHTLEGVAEVHAYHVVPSGVSKSLAITADLASRGLTATEAMAIGDSAADVAMADAVGLAVLVRNGLDDPSVLAAAAGRTNVAAVRGSRGVGWRELADAWVEHATA